MDGKMKVIFLVLLAAYIISPVDLMPGCPIDDVIMCLLYAYFNRNTITGRGGEEI